MSTGEAGLAGCGGGGGRYVVKPILLWRAVTINAGAAKG